MLTLQAQLDEIKRRLAFEKGSLVPFCRRILAMLTQFDDTGADPAEQLEWLRQYTKGIADSARVRIIADRQAKRPRFVQIVDQVPEDLGREHLRNWLSSRPQASELLYERAGTIHNQLEEWRILGTPIGIRILDAARMLAQVDPSWFWHFSVIRAWFMRNARRQIWDRLETIASPERYLPSRAPWHDGAFAILPVRSSYLGYESNWLFANCLSSAWKEHGVDHDSDLSRVWIEAAMEYRKRWFIRKAISILRRTSVRGS